MDMPNAYAMNIKSIRLPSSQYVSMGFVTIGPPSQNIIMYQLFIIFIRRYSIENVFFFAQQKSRRRKLKMKKKTVEIERLKFLRIQCTLAAYVL